MLRYVIALLRMALMAVGWSDSVTPFTAVLGGRQTSYARVAAYSSLRALRPRFV